MPTLSELRASLTTVQRAAINTIYEYEQKTGNHIPVIKLYELCGGDQAVENALSGLSDRILLKHPSHGGRRRYGLKFLGYLLSDEGKKIQNVLVHYFEYLRSKLQEDPEFNGVKFDELPKEAHFSEDELKLFKKIIYCTPFYNGDVGIPNPDEWYSGDLNSYIEKIALREGSAMGLIGLNVQPQAPYFGASHLITENFNSSAPENISESLRSFKRDHPDPGKVGFVMMRFDENDTQETIFRAIAHTLQSVGLTAVRADVKEYDDNLLGNAKTYLYGCEFGIAVFEHIDGESFNPNVALEVGYMMALKKQICLLKDRRLPKLPTDLAGRLYRDFDPEDIDTTISKALRSWLKDKGIVS